jgi:hypothetical protein
LRDQVHPATISELCVSNLNPNSKYMTTPQIFAINQGLPGSILLAGSSSGGGGVGGSSCTRCQTAHCTN